MRYRQPPFIINLVSLTSLKTKQRLQIDRFIQREDSIKDTCDCDKFPIISDKSFPEMVVSALSSLQHLSISFFTLSICSLLRPTIVMSKADIFLSNK